MLGLAAALALAAGSAAGAPLPRYGVFVFSSLCSHKDSGDISGSRLTLSRSVRGDRLTFEYGNGPLETAETLSLRVHGDMLRARASTNDGDLGLAARLRDGDAILSARFDFQKPLSAKPETLRRIENGAQKIPECGA